MAHNDLSPPDTIVWTDVVMAREGRRDKWSWSAHYQGGRALGGRELFHHGGAKWTPLKKMDVRWRVPAEGGTDDLYFSGPPHPDDDIDRP